MEPEDFKQLLREQTAGEIVDSYILADDPGPYTTREALGLLEREVRVAFQLSPDHTFSTFVVGSAKLGFAFLEKRARNGIASKPAYRLYQPGESDIDVAVVSPMLYMRIWRDLARFGANQTPFPWRTELADYMLHGWIRPDKFPHAVPQCCNDWKSVVNNVSRMEPFRYKRLRCALYYSTYFLKNYQQRGVLAAQQAELAS